MIWFWISILFLIISVLFFAFKIPFQFLFIALIPIQRYGFSLFGLNVKPFHIFALFLLIYIILKYKKDIVHLIGRKIMIPVLLVCLLFSMVLVNLINGGGIASIEYVGVVFLTIFSCFVFVLSIQNIDNLLGVLFKSVVISSTIFSVFFVLVCLLSSFDINLPETTIDALADASTARGVVTIYRKRSTSVMIAQARIIGFAVDPNAFSVTLLAPICILLNKLCVYKSTLKKSIPLLACLAIITVCLVLGQSRTAWFLIAFIAFLFIFWLFISKEQSLSKRLVVVSLLVLIIAGLEVFFKGKLFHEIIKIFHSRSLFFGDGGRLSLWISSMETLCSKNPIFGLGLGVFSNTADLEVHNTWLEYYAGCGFIVGIFSSFIFIYVFYSLYVKASIYSFNYKNNDGWMVFIILLAVSSALMFISYIASPDFWLYFVIACRFDSLLPTQYRNRIKKRTTRLYLPNVAN